MGHFFFLQPLEYFFLVIFVINKEIERHGNEIMCLLLPFQKLNESSTVFVGRSVAFTKILLLDRSLHSTVHCTAAQPASVCIVTVSACLLDSFDHTQPSSLRGTF